MNGQDFINWVWAFYTAHPFWIGVIFPPLGGWGAIFTGNLIAFLWSFLGIFIRCAVVKIYKAAKKTLKETA